MMNELRLHVYLLLLFPLWLLCVAGFGGCARASVQQEETIETEIEIEKENNNEIETEIEKENNNEIETEIEKENNNETEIETETDTDTKTENKYEHETTQKNKRKLVSKHIDGETFKRVQDMATPYSTLSDPSNTVVAGVVPHHLTAAPFIGGFFASLADSGADYDAVVLIGPNHVSNTGDVVISARDWDFGDGVACETSLAAQIKRIPLHTARIIENDTRMEDDHAVSTFIPFVHHYWPDAKVVPMLVSRSLSFDDTLFFVRSLYDLLDAYEGRVLLLCSIDFSHYLTPSEAARHDEITLAAIQKTDCHEIHAFSNAHLDSPASLIIFLQYVQLHKASLTVLDHGDASLFIGHDVPETTSYFLLAGVTNITDDR